MDQELPIPPMTRPDSHPSKVSQTHCEIALPSHVQETTPSETEAVRKNQKNDAKCHKQTKRRMGAQPSKKRSSYE